MRKKLVGQTVVFVREFIATSGREHGRIYLGGTSKFFLKFFKIDKFLRLIGFLWHFS